MNLFEEEKKISLETDKDYEDLFEKVAQETKPASFSEFEETIKNTFNNNEEISNHFKKYSEKLKLDRTKLNELFQK